MFEERLLLAGGLVLEARIAGDREYLLSLGRDGRVLVEYRSGDGYDFRSVEKLRYDFERDVEDALRQG